jgi:hypothetical protein
MTREEIISMTDREAMKMALEALEEGVYQEHPLAQHAITALRTAIAEAEKQEPVATVVSENEPVTMSWWHEPALPVGTKLYTTPPTAQRQWVGLTEWEVIEMKAAIKGTLDVQFIDFASAIEAKLREKNA